MNDFQITTITVENNNELGQGATMRKVSYSGTFVDHSHTEGFILITDDEFNSTTMNDLKINLAKKLVGNLEEVK